MSVWFQNKRAKEKTTGQHSKDYTPLNEHTIKKTVFESSEVCVPMVQPKLAVPNMQSFSLIIDGSKPSTQIFINHTNNIENDSARPNVVATPMKNSSSSFCHYKLDFSAVGSTSSKPILKYDLDSQKEKNYKDVREKSSRKDLTDHKPLIQASTSTYFDSLEAYSPIKPELISLSMKETSNELAISVEAKSPFQPKLASQSFSLNSKTSSLLTSPQKTDLVPSSTKLNSSSIFTSHEVDFSTTQTTSGKSLLKHLNPPRKGGHKIHLSVRQIPTRTSSTVVPKYKAS